LVLRSLNYGNDREPNKLEALLNSKNEKIASVSEDTRKRLEKEEAARREALAAEYYDNVLERCLSQGGAVALEESEKALKNLQEIASYMESKEEGWADERLSAINKRRFDAAKAIIEKGRVFGNEKKG